MAALACNNYSCVSFHYPACRIIPTTVTPEDEDIAYGFGVCSSTGMENVAIGVSYDQSRIYSSGIGNLMSGVGYHFQVSEKVGVYWMADLEVQLESLPR